MSKAHSVEELRNVFEYDEATGKLFWKNWLPKVNNKEAGSIWRDGYVYVRFDKKLYLAHRIIFAIVFGRWPENIDHINCKKSDNRLSNLREASVAQNNRNRPKQSNNTTGFKGVSFHKPTGRFVAKIMSNKKTKCLGYFKTARDAGIAYANAAKDLHGVFASM